MTDTQTAKDKVLAVYPDAFAWKYESNGDWVISDGNHDTDYGEGATEGQAWEDAASGLPSGVPIHDEVTGGLRGRRP